MNIIPIHKKGDLSLGIRTITSQILALRQLIEGVKDKKLEAILIFIEFKKDFDTIHRGKILAILNDYGIADELVKAISIMYEDYTTKVLQLMDK